MSGSTVKIVQATKLNRVKTFIKSDGQKVEGGAEAYYKSGDGGKTPNIKDFKFK